VLVDIPRCAIDAHGARIEGADSVEKADAGIFRALLILRLATTRAAERKTVRRIIIRYEDLDDGAMPCLFCFFYKQFGFVIWSLLKLCSDSREAQWL
jgi:hypothetical protein